MYHVHVKVEKECDVVCSICGEVFDQNYDFTPSQTALTFYPGLEKMMLPLSLSNTIGSKEKWRDNYDKKIINYYRVFDRLLSTIDEIKLPRYYALETMRRLLAKNKGMYSYRKQIKELIQVLENQQDARLYNHINKLRSKINEVQGI